MSRVFLNNNAINQKGTPLLYTDILSNRPQYGINGRLFFSTDSQQIFEDTGTSWLLLADATGSVSGYVPYVGATTNLNLGLFNITASSFISGNFTTGSVLFIGSSNNINQDNSNFFWDDTNNRLGIGTNIPGTNIDVHGTSNVLMQLNNIDVSGNLNTTIAFQNQNIANWRIGNYPNSGQQIFKIYDVLNSRDSLTIIGTQINTSLDFTAAKITGNYIVKSGGTSSQILAADGSVITAGSNIIISGSTISTSGGTTTNALTLNNSGTGAASGSTFNGSAAITLSYNTIGAQQALTLTTTGTSGAATLISGTLNIPNYAPDLSGYVTLATTQTLTGFKTFNPSVTASSAIARGGYYTPALTAAANNDVLVGLDINPTFTNGAFTGVTNLGLRVVGKDATINGLTVGLGGGSLASNTVLGYQAGAGVNSGNGRNVNLGYQAGYSNTSGYNHINIGYQAGYSQVSQDDNIAIGYKALYTNNSYYSIAIGTQALTLSTSNQNIAIGVQSGGSITTGIHNVLIGNSIMYGGSSGVGSSYNTALGNSALAANYGNNNIAIGYFALTNNTSGVSNISIGYLASQYATTGSSNVTIGALANRFISGGTVNSTIQGNSIFIGESVKPLADNQTNQIVIGYNETGLGSNTTILGNASTLTTAIRGNLLLGSTTDNGTDKLQVTGSAIFSTKISTTAGTNTFNTTSGNTLIGSTTDNGKKLQVNGTTTTSAFAAAGATYTVSAILSEAYYHVFQGSTGQTLTLLSPSSNNLQYVIINNSANTLTVAANGANTIYTPSGTNVSSITLIAYQRVFILADGGNKYYQIF